MTDKAEKRAYKALEKILHDRPAWSAAMGLLQARAIRDDLVMLRLQKGISREQIAERMGISVNRLEDLETCDWPDMRMSTLRRWNMAVGAVIHMSVSMSLEAMLEEQEVDESKATLTIDVPEELERKPRAKS